MLGLAHNASPELVFWRKRALDLAHDNCTLRAENVRLRNELAALSNDGQLGGIVALSRPITAVQLTALQSFDLSHCEAYVFGDLPDGTVHEHDAETPEQYAHHFLPVVGGCPSCGGWWAWSIIHGAGYCVICGYAMHALHYFREPGKDKDTLVYAPLWYHPDELAVCA